MDTDSDDDSGSNVSAEQKINEHRDALQDLADSDLPAAWVAEELLGVVDDRGDAA